MPILEDYAHFAGQHHESGSLHNVLAYKATDDDYKLSEAMLLGISGGVTAGYFVFDKPNAPRDLLLTTRNTYQAMDAVYERLSIRTDTLVTASFKRADKHLRDALAVGNPPIVWGDIYSLAYNHLQRQKGVWLMRPLVVYGIDDEMETAHIADRAQVPLMVSQAQLAHARARRTQARHKLVTLGTPNLKRLPSAIVQGVQQCMRMNQGGRDRLDTRGRLGFVGLKRLAKDLVSDEKRGWGRRFATPEDLYNALSSLYACIEFREAQNGASRGVYADFVDEASVILRQPALLDVAEQFRVSQGEWRKLAAMCLPDDAPLLKQTRDLMTEKARRFHEQGQGATQELGQMTTQLAALKGEIVADFPLTAHEIADLRAVLHDQVLKITTIESKAFALLHALVTAAKSPRSIMQ